METAEIINLFNDSNYSFLKYQLSIIDNDENNNKWYDKNNNLYEFSKDILTIYTLGFDYSLISVIDKIPNKIKLNFIINNTEGTIFINKLIEVISKSKRDNITITLDSCMFPSNADINIGSLGNKIKLNNYVNNSYTCQCLDWYALNLDDEKFYILAKSLEPFTQRRILIMRKIAHEFNKELNSKNIYSVDAKAKTAYFWCKKNIKYAKEATNPNGTVAIHGNWAKDPIQTYIKKRGVCIGRAKLLKILLNNYYTRVKCYTVDGITITNLNHEWNEYVTSNGVVVQMDLSNQISVEENHYDYELNEGKYTQKQKLELVETEITPSSKVNKKIKKLSLQIKRDIQGFKQ